MTSSLFLPSSLAVVLLASNTNAQNPFYNITKDPFFNLGPPTKAENIIPASIIGGICALVIILGCCSAWCKAREASDLSYGGGFRHSGSSRPAASTGRTRKPLFGGWRLFGGERRNRRDCDDRQMQALPVRQAQQQQQSHYTRQKTSQQPSCKYTNDTALRSDTQYHSPLSPVSSAPPPYTPGGNVDGVAPGTYAPPPEPPPLAHLKNDFFIGGSNNV